MQIGTALPLLPRAGRRSRYRHPGSVSGAPGNRPNAGTGMTATPFRARLQVLEIVAGLANASVMAGAGFRRLWHHHVTTARQVLRVVQGPGTPERDTGDDLDVRRWLGPCWPRASGEGEAAVNLE